MRTNRSKNYKNLFVLPIVAVILSACGKGNVQPDTTETAIDTIETHSMSSIETPVELEVIKATPESSGDSVLIRPDAPKRYVVKKGDTLWAISKMFLTKPWRWPEVWYYNPQVKNPHLIYPGDVLVLTYRNGKAMISFGEGGHNFNSAYPHGQLVDGVMKLSPITRSNGDNAISTIPLEKIIPFMRSARIFNKDEMHLLPKIVGTLDSRLITENNSEVYATGIPVDTQESVYQVLRKGRVFKNAKGRILGYEARIVAKSKLTKLAKTPELPSTLFIVDNDIETIKGDRLAPYQGIESNLTFVPRDPGFEFNGKVIATHSGSRKVASNQVLIIDKGANQGFKPGHIVSINQRGSISRITDPSTTRRTEMRMPNIRAGLGVVFSVHDELSYVLVIDSTRAISKNDTISRPSAGIDY